MKRLLVVDDDARMRRVLEMLASKIGLNCTAASGANEASACFRAERSDVVVTDLKMPGKSGIEFLRDLREIDAEVPVIVLTAHGTVPTAVEAMKLGAVDYLQKPFDVDALEMVIRRALDLSRFRLENRFLREQSGVTARSGELIAGSPVMAPIFELIRQVAPTRSSVLVTGETGTGKELVARAIHDLSPRRDKLFVPLNCTAIPSELLESELFGHVRGAFSGAQADRVGKFQAADEGTLFLDEVGDMDVRLQAKLLRVLQEGVIEPLGTNRRMPVDVRIVSSTNRDLERGLKEGKFREDLYFRLNVIHLRLPPLRERSEDIPALVDYFLRRFFRARGKEPKPISPAMLDVFVRYSWPGNVRELENTCERIAQTCICDAVVAGCVPATILFHRPDGRADPPLGELPPAAAEPLVASGTSLDQRLRAVETQLITWALRKTGGNKSKAATVLNVRRSTLGDRIKKLGLSHLESKRAGSP